MELDHTKIAVCGLECGKCPVYQATRTADIKQKRLRSPGTGQPAASPFSPADISSDSCMTAGQKFQFCQICAIRLCATEQGLRNYAYCPEFTCTQLEDHWKSSNASQYRETLLGIRAQ
jgi:hypothetical protein